MGMLREKFEKKYRVERNQNREDVIRMAGSKGEVYEIGDSGMGIHFSDCKPGVKMKRFLGAVPEAVVVQEGDWEVVFSVPWEFAEKALKASKAFKRRKVSPEQRARLVSINPHFQKRPPLGVRK